MRLISIEAKPIKAVVHPTALAGYVCHWAWVFLVMFGTQRIFGGDALAGADFPVPLFTVTHFVGTFLAPAIAYAARRTLFGERGHMLIAALVVIEAVCMAVYLVLLYLSGTPNNAASSVIAGLVSGLVSGIFLVCWVLVFSSLSTTSVILNASLAYLVAFVSYVTVSHVAGQIVFIAVVCLVCVAEGLFVSSSLGDVLPPDVDHVIAPGESAESGLSWKPLAKTGCLFVVLGASKSVLNELSLSNMGSLTASFDIVLGMLLTVVAFSLFALVALVFPGIQSHAGASVLLGLVGFSVVLLSLIGTEDRLVYAVTCSVSHLVLEVLVVALIAWACRGESAETQPSLARVALLVTCLFVGQEITPALNGFAANLGDFLQLTTVAQPMVLMLLLLVGVVLLSSASPGRTEPVEKVVFAVTEDELTARRVEAIVTSYLLTDRERDVLLMLARGRTLPAIGKSLYISENTVKTHVRSIYRKTGVHSREGLLSMIEETLEVVADR